MAEHETTADVIAEMRDLAEHRDWNNHTRQSNRERVSDFADRLEAALGRELGDAAKLREALMYAEQVLDTAARNVRGETGMVINSAYSEAARKCRAALAAPPRNCDIAQDWIHDLYVKFKPPASVKREMSPEWVDAVMAFCRWLVAPATEQKGGNDAN